MSTWTIDDALDEYMAVPGYDGQHRRAGRSWAWAHTARHAAADGQFSTRTDADIAQAVALAHDTRPALRAVSS